MFKFSGKKSSDSLVTLLLSEREKNSGIDAIYLKSLGKTIGPLESIENRLVR